MASNSHQEPWLLENGNVKTLSKEMRHGRTHHNMSSSSLRKKSDLKLVSKVPITCLRQLLANLQEVILGTKLSVLFPAIPLAIAAEIYGFGRPWVFALSLLGLTPLAERVSFLTEQIAYYTGPTVGGLLNATCGNATELIIAIFALSDHKIALVKYSLLGSILSNLLLVLGTSLFCGGIANLRREQKYDRRQADVNSLLLLLALLCHLLPTLFRHSGALPEFTVVPTIQLSRASSIVMLLAYTAYIVFQLWTHRQLFEAQEESEDGAEGEEEVPVIGFWSGFVWLVGMTIFIAVLSEYVVATIEDASDSWGLSVGFLSIILLPIVGNAAEHAGAVIFAFKNKLDISLGVALGSATQIALFVVPLCVVVAWIMGIHMDLDFNTLETTSLALSIIVTAFTLQDGTSHYMKGLVLLLCYIVIAACFFVSKTPLRKKHRQLRTSDDYRRSLKRLTGLFALRGHCSDKYSSIETSTDATDLLVQF
uniref:Vacuolar cation/proton exchanger n=1 Tax=Quercus lobata TaxID=97700 RepID=A0A7N2M5A7_QUELO